MQRRCATQHNPAQGGAPGEGQGATGQPVEGPQSGSLEKWVLGPLPSWSTKFPVFRRAMHQRGQEEVGNKQSSCGRLRNPEQSHHACRCCYVRLFATPWTVAHQASLSTGFSRQEYGSGLPSPPPGDLPDSGIEPMSPAFPAVQTDSLPLSYWGSSARYPGKLKEMSCSAPCFPFKIWSIQKQLMVHCLRE